MKNYDILLAGLETIYSNNSHDNFNLTTKQIEEILDYYEELGEEFELEQYIDEVIINGYGFDENGILLEEAGLDEDLEPERER